MKQVAPLTAAGHRAAVVKLMRHASHRHQLWDVFGDFIECAAISLANAVDIRQHVAREERYHRIRQRYSVEEFATFPRMLAHVVDAMTLEPCDVLGMIFGELELGNAARGQFFTPYSICHMMAGLMIGDAAQARAAIAGRGFFTVSEPACGAGAMVIGMAMHLHGLDVDYQRTMHVTAVDVDSRAVHMAFIQFSLLHIPAIVIRGNTLTLQEDEHWYTPAHIIGGWSSKLRRQPADPVSLEQVHQQAENMHQADLFGVPA